MNYYLKINRDTPYAYKCLKKWIDIIQKIEKSSIYIVCDKENITNKIKCEFDVYDNFHYLQSQYNNELIKRIISRITDKVWENAGYAHLTTIFHAVDTGEEYFWNIDADDTMFCAYDETVRKILYQAEKCMRGGDGLSLDMNMSRTNGRIWTFGVTIMNARKDWLGEIEKRSTCHEYEHLHKLWQEKNANCIDFFFSYLWKIGAFNLQSFYVENMKFIHFSNNFLLIPYDGGIYTWKNDKFVSLALYYIYSAKKIGSLPIAQSVFKLLTIEAGESDDFLQSYIPMIKMMVSSPCPYILQNIAEDLDRSLQEK